MLCCSYEHVTVSTDVMFQLRTSTDVMFQLWTCNCIYRYINVAASNVMLQLWTCNCIYRYINVAASNVMLPLWTCNCIYTYINAAASNVMLQLGLHYLWRSLKKNKLYTASGPTPMKNYGCEPASTPKHKSVRHSLRRPSPRHIRW